MARKQAAWPCVTPQLFSSAAFLPQSLAYNSDFKVKMLTYAGAANAYTYDNDNLLTGSGATPSAATAKTGCRRRSPATA